MKDRSRKSRVSNKEIIVQRVRARGQKRRARVRADIEEEASAKTDSIIVNLKVDILMNSWNRKFNLA